MTFGSAGKLFAVIWCLATEKPSWDAFDMDDWENKELVSEHPVLASAFFPLAGLLPGCLLFFAASFMKVFMPEFGGALLFGLAGVFLSEYIYGWRSIAVCARFIQNRCSGESWPDAADDLQGGLEKLTSAAGSLAVMIIFIIKTAGFMTLYMQERTGIVIILLMMPFAVQGLLALRSGCGGSPVIDGGKEGMIYLLTVTALLLFCGVSAAPAALAAAAAACWIIYEIVSRGGSAVRGGVPVSWITLAGNTAEVCCLFSALILIG